MTKKKHRGVMPVKGYYTRARVFGYLMLSMAILYLVYYIFKGMTD
jgi:hypothetical protein